MNIEIPGFRDDDALLYINRRFHSMFFFCLPHFPIFLLLSMTTHLALLTSRLPALKSEKDEDPLFDDDWDASMSLYPKGSAKSSTDSEAAKPPVIVLAMTVGQNAIFDPCKEELVVVDVVLAVACISSQPTGARIVSIRTIDPTSYLTPPGIPNSMNSEAPIRAGS
ncbi:hypothetical protein V2W45_1337765 [Cenococcum geophilum]